MDARDTGAGVRIPQPGAHGQDLSPVKKALVEIRRLNRQLHDEQARRSQPVALIGMGMRFPGGVSRTEDLVRVLRDGVEAVGAVPRDRWDNDAYYRPGGPSPGKYYVDQGGFLGGVDLFDPEFFGIAPLEAATLDPQQRILLETAWEALEDAAVPSASLRGSRTGVFLGIGTTDYHRAVLADAGAIDTYASTGTAFSVASGRIAYLLDLRGPALSVDTACSSSLVAVHLACQSLRSGESDVALAGGVSLILSPEITINFCQAGMLSPDGRCKTFDAAADGYVRSEGCGVVVLKRLDDALRDGDRVLAVVRGSAVNQDGRSSGLTAPNGPAQEAVIRSALSNSGLTPDDIGYVEAHGTGTSLGDPIEVRALGAVFGRGHRPSPLRIGSAKTNFGHLEAAAGVAGLMKAVVALQSGTIPPHLHFRTPNPHIPWDEFELEVPAMAQALEPTGGARRVGVSSFGFSGTNAHVILEEPPKATADPASGTVLPERPLHVLTLSAPHHDGLKALAGRYVAHLQDSSAAFPDACFTANTGRTHFQRRVAVVAGTAADAARALSAWIEGRDTPAVFAGESGGGADGRRGSACAFVFPATAPDLAGVADSAPAARRTLDLWNDEARRRLGAALGMDSAAAPGAGGDGTVGSARLRASANQHGLAELWKAWGVRPDVVSADGAGHLAAAVAAGILDVADAVGTEGAPETRGGPGTADPSRAGTGSPPGAPVTPVRYIVAGTGDGEGPTVVGDADAWRAASTEAPGLTRLRAALAAEDVGRTMMMGPAAGFETPGSTVIAPGVAGPLGWEDLLSGLARLYVSGVDVDWRGVDEGHVRTRVSLPSYPFQRRRFWLERWPAPRSSSTATGVAEADPWTSATDAARHRAGLAPLDLSVGSYPAKWAVLNELTHAVGRNMLAGLGVFGQAGATAGVDDIIQNHGVDPLYRPIVQRWLLSLEREGALVRAGGDWTAITPLESTDLAPLWRRVDEAMADNPALLAYVRNSATKAEGVLTGRVSSLETLFPDGSFDLASELYESATQLRYVNGIAAAALEAFVSARPFAAPVRVLEVGAGTGGTTSSLLPVLPADRASYDYSDVSDVFLDWGREKFASVPFLHTRRFDLEVDPRDQGIEAGSYDVIVGSNVLHAVRDLRATLERVRSLLSPGGLLLLVESTGHLPWHDITTGLIEGWQHFDDDLRTDTPLLPVDTWRTLMAEAGFRASDAAPPPDSPAGVLQQHVILAVAEGQAPVGSVGTDRTGAGADGEAAPVRRGVAAGPGAGTDPASGISGPGGGAPGEHAPGEPATPAEVLAGRLADAIGSERQEIVADAVRDCVMEILHSDPARPPSKDARLMELGLDSLMAVRLRNLLEKRLGLDGRLPSTLVFDHPTIRHIATLALGHMAGASEGSGAASDQDHHRRSEVAGLSDEEAEARLLERLERGDL